jgi:predicted PurR-regulated permease PerM
MAQPTDIQSSPSGNWWQQLTPSKVAQGVVVVLLVIVGFLAILALRNVLILLFVGIVLATAVRPLMNRLRAVHLPRSLSALGALLLLVGLLYAVIVAVAPFLLIQAQRLMEQVPSYYASLRQSLVGSRFLVVQLFGNRLPPSVEATPSEGPGLLVQLASYLPSIVSVGLALLGAFLFSYYWLLYRDRALQSLVLLLPLDTRDRARELWEQIEGKIGAFVRGQLLLGVSVGSLSLLGFWLIGLPYAPLLAVIAGLMELVPVVGPLIAAVPAIAVGLSSSPELGLYAALVALVVQQLENNLLVPKIMDQTVGVSPVVSLLALVAFAALFGFVGALLAIPLAAVLQVLLDAWLLRNTVTSEQVQGRDELAVLRYEVQDLTQDLRGQLRLATPESTDPDEDVVEEELEAIIGAVDELLAEAQAARNANHLDVRQGLARLPFSRGEAP